MAGAGAGSAMPPACTLAGAHCGDKGPWHRHPRHVQGEKEEQASPLVAAVLIHTVISQLSSPLCMSLALVNIYDLCPEAG